MKKNKDELKKEEQIIGWEVIVFFNQSVSPYYGGVYQASQSIKVDSWKEASKIASQITHEGTYTPIEDKGNLFLKDEQIVSYVKTVPITRIIYVE